jgi:hypothetical protein
MENTQLNPAIHTPYNAAARKAGEQLALFC